MPKVAASSCLLLKLSISAGIANCLLGVILMHDLKNAALVAWLTPICVLLGLLALTGLVLEVPKRTVSRLVTMSVVEPVTNNQISSSCNMSRSYMLLGLLAFTGLGWRCQAHGEPPHYVTCH
jgi:hypothetical protein